MIDRDAVIDMAVAGSPIRAIARHHSCSQSAVQTVLDEYAAEQLKPSARAAALALEVDRLERMEATFLKEAIANHHVQAGTLVVKISSRKAQLLGLD